MPDATQRMSRVAVRPHWYMHGRQLLGTSPSRACWLRWLDDERCRCSSSAWPCAGERGAPQGEGGRAAGSARLPAVLGGDRCLGARHGVRHAMMLWLSVWLCWEFLLGDFELRRPTPRAACIIRIAPPPRRYGPSITSHAEHIIVIGWIRITCDQQQGSPPPSTLLNRLPIRAP